MKNYLNIFLSFITPFLIGTSVFVQGTMLLRQPTIAKDEIVFVYANDLWKVGVDGGDAVRLTSNIGGETNPHFSPDGRFVATVFR